MTATSSLRGLASVVPVSDPSTVPLERQSILLYGPPKIGKTTLASQWPNALFLDAEAGTLNLAVPTFDSLIGKDRVSDPIKSWDQVKAATSVLAGIENAEGTIVIDPVNEVFAMCREWVLLQNNWSHETDGAYGKGWRAVKDEFTSWVRQLRAMPFGIIFVAHENTIEIETATEKYEKVVPRMEKAVKEIVEPLVNMIWYAHSREFKGVPEPVQVVQTKPTKQVTAGERGDVPRLRLYEPMNFVDINRQWNGENAVVEPAS